MFVPMAGNKYWSAALAWHVLKLFAFILVTIKLNFGKPNQPNITHIFVYVKTRNCIDHPVGDLLVGQTYIFINIDSCFFYEIKYIRRHHQMLISLSLKFVTHLYILRRDFFFDDHVHFYQKLTSQNNRVFPFNPLMSIHMRMHWNGVCVCVLKFGQANF